MKKRKKLLKRSILLLLTRLRRDLILPLLLRLPGLQASLLPLTMLQLLKLMLPPLLRLPGLQALLLPLTLPKLLKLPFLLTMRQVQKSGSLISKVPMKAVLW